ELAQAGEPVADERGSIVGTDRVRQAVAPEGLDQLLLRPGEGRRALSATGEQKAGMGIRQCEGIAVLAVPHPELALEISGPHLVRALRPQRSGGQKAWLLPTFARLDQTFTKEELAYSAGGGKLAPQ